MQHEYGQTLTGSLFIRVAQKLCHVPRACQLYVLTMVGSLQNKLFAVALLLLWK